MGDGEDAWKKLVTLARRIFFHWNDIEREARGRGVRVCVKVKERGYKRKKEMKEEKETRASPWAHCGMLQGQQQHQKYLCCTE